MTATTTAPILTEDEHRLVHRAAKMLRALDALPADAPCCPDCGRPKLSAVLGDDTVEAP